MNINIRQLGSIALVAVLITSFMGGGMAAIIDQETSVTGTQSQLTSSSTVADYAGGPIANGSIEANVTSTDPAFRVIDAETGMTIDTLKGDDLNQTGSLDTGTDGNADAWYYRTNVSDAFSMVPINSGENKTVAVRIVDNHTLDDQNETGTWLNVTVEGVNGRAVFAGMDSNLDLFRDEGYSIFGYSLFDNSRTTFEQSNVGINGTGSMVELDVWNDSAAEDFSTSATDMSSGDWIWTTQLWIEDTNAHKVYYEEAPDDVDNDTTYGVYKPSMNAVDVNVGEEYSDMDAVDVRIIGNQAYGLSERFNNFGWQNALGALNPL